MKPFLSQVILLGLVLSALPPPVSGPAYAQEPEGDCASEPQLAEDGGVVFCEPWESDTWWRDHGFTAHGGLERREVMPDRELAYATLTDEGCRSGRCLRLLAERGATRQLSIDWPLANADLQPEELYFRYYIRLGPEWDPRQCDDDGSEVWPAGGKLPGFADARVNSDPGGQCGNGGASADGINCWSARGLFAGCEGTGGDDSGFPYGDTCEFVPGAVTRIGSYVYHPGQANTTGSNGLWDFVAEDQTTADDYRSGAECRRADPRVDPEPECYCGAENNLFCGIGRGGMLARDRWYAIETYVRMNTPGEADGVLRGWVDGVLSYEKTNMKWREPGHDNLHVRSIWLNVYKGGVNGNCQRGFVYLDNMVVSQNPIGTLDTRAPPIPMRDAGSRPGEDGGMPQSDAGVDARMPDAQANLDVNPASDRVVSGEMGCSVVPAEPHHVTYLLLLLFAIGRIARRAKGPCR